MIYGAQLGTYDKSTIFNRNYNYFNFRYLLRLNDHYVVTNTLDFMLEVVNRMERLFSLLFLKKMEPLLKPIAEKKVN